MARSRAWWLAAVLALACDGGLRLVVVERGDLGVSGTSPGGAESKAGNGTVIPQGGAAAQGGSGNGNAAGTSGSAGNVDEVPGAAGAAGAPDVPYWAEPARYTASFTSHAYPSQYIRYIDDQGFIAPIDMSSLAEQEAASWEVAPGLWGEKYHSCSALRAVSKPGAFLRHANSRLYLRVAPPDDALFLADATFCEEPGLADSAGVSFVSANYPQRVIHLRNKNELWIDDVPPTDADDYATFASESTFYRHRALNETVSP